MILYIKISKVVEVRKIKEIDETNQVDYLLVSKHHYHNHNINIHYTNTCLVVVAVDVQKNQHHARKDSYNHVADRKWDDKYLFGSLIIIIPG